ncbi:VIT1/CCC1 transporter family protein [Geofilum sp. OHC36d9]|uniref:VIT1/CCC1 transporter family protein n=1 Tax=Geofilum sp. OHC36d9 TaxID=3458413 RepID=UPI0040341643
MDPKAIKYALKSQKTEITEYHIYKALAKRSKNETNKSVLNRIGDQELGHARFWETKTGVKLQPDKWRIFRTLFLVRVLGLTFVLKLMEKKEGTGSGNYQILSQYYPEAEQLAKEEAEHEKSVLNMLEESHLQYVGSIVLGLNDALVELTGALAGFTLALADSRIISLVGLVTGISAALSMAASEFLSSKAEGDETAGKSAIYTGISYLITVTLLILPFLLLDNQFIALAIVLLTAVLIIFCFNYYLAIAKDLNFKHRFWEMTLISLGVAAFSFFVGYLLRSLLGVDI